MKIKIIALSLMSLCASQAFGNVFHDYLFYITNNTADRYSVMANDYGQDEFSAYPGKTIISTKAGACYSNLIFKRFYVDNGVNKNDGWVQVQGIAAGVSEEPCGKDMNIIINGFQDVTINGVRYIPPKNQSSKAIDQTVSTAIQSFIK